MTDLSLLQSLALPAIYLLAGATKGLVGMGLPTVAVGLTSLFASPAEAAALVVVPSLVTNLWQMVDGRHLVPLLRRLWPLLAGIVAGTAVGALLTTEGLREWARPALGLVLLIYALHGVRTAGHRLPERWDSWAGAAAGVATGLITVATGVFIIPAVPYLQALGLSKEALVQALGLSFTVSTVALAGALAGLGPLDAHSLLLSALATLPALVGMLAGRRLRAAMDATRFRRCVFLGLGGLGLHLLAQAL